jgi:hypothetical protein
MCLFASRVQRFGHTTVVSLLLEAGADWKHTDNSGRTALDWAKDGAEGGHSSEDAAVVLGAWVATVELRDEMARHTTTSTSASAAGPTTAAPSVDADA